ncbi:MAG: aminopeptidase P family protein [Candidatus Altiarchaeota archaeon]|nr:aminopeptidase P family protein [Candidatus Altiarchaeota archaeon]
MITAREISRRVDRIHSSMEDEGVKALLVSGPRNVAYLTGRDTGRLLLTLKGDFLWTRELYHEVYSDLYFDPSYPYEIGIYDRDAIKKELTRLRLKRPGIENVSVLACRSIEDALKVKPLVTDLVERQRSVKSKLEIELLGRSADIAVKGMKKACRVVRCGVRELDAAASIEYEIRRLGSDSPPFEEGLLLSSGADAADIHAKPGFKKMRKGSLAVVDLGARYCGYYSDMTRTFKIGKVDREARDIIEFVDSLRGEAIDRLAVGDRAAGVHSYIEGRIEAKGFRFYHSSGHGVGLNIHELPNISERSEDVLERNMVFTIEPGIYVPGKYGIRFEDMVLLGKNKAKVLTRYKL